MALMKKRNVKTRGEQSGQESCALAPNVSSKEVDNEHPEDAENHRRVDCSIVEADVDSYSGEKLVDERPSKACTRIASSDRWSSKWKPRFEICVRVPALPSSRGYLSHVVEVEVGVEFADVGSPPEGKQADDCGQG